jgi:virulence-associated protein VagC
MSFPDDVTELEISRVGDVLTLRPTNLRWAEFFETWAEPDPSDAAFFSDLEQRSDVVEYRPLSLDSLADDGGPGEQ